MKKILGRMGRNTLLLVMLASQLWSCGEVDITSTPNGYFISGQITSGGSGLAGVTITLSGADQGTTTSNAAGNYTFSGLLNGSYTVTPAPPAGFTFNPASRALIVSNANITGVNFSASPTALVQLVACPASGTTNVIIQDFSYTPSVITVGVNSIVKWTNNGFSTHTVTSGISPNLDGKFNSPTLGTGVTVCYQFLATGTYPYFCTIHPLMSGSVAVQ